MPSMHVGRPKKFIDDGTTVTVDLHGCTVSDGLYIIGRTVQEAHRRGRMKVDVIHGTSTSRAYSRARTIKNEFRRRLDAREYDEWVSGHNESSSGGNTSLWLNLGSNSDPSRIKVTDVIPRRR